MTSLVISLDADSLTTGQMLQVMKHQESLAKNENVAESMTAIIEIIGRSVTQIEYKGDRLQSLNDVPFRLLRDALTDIMKRLTSTDPN